MDRRFQRWWRTARPRWWRGPPPSEQPKPATSRRPVRVSLSALARLAAQDQKPEPVNPFQMPEYPPGVLPNGRRLAMDDANGQQIQAVFGYGSGFHGLWAEGIGFMGYPALAELAQRPEYRRASEVIAEEMTRKWIRLKATGTEDKADKLNALRAALDQHRVQEVFRDAIELDGLFGRAQVFPDYGINDDRAELLTRLVLRPEKIGRGRLRGFNVIDPTWTAPNQYNTLDPLDRTFYKPQSWFVMGKEVHASRLLTLVSRPLPDLLKPAYNFGGLALSQMMKPYVDNWLRTRQSVSDLLNSFTVFNLETNLQALLSTPEDEIGAADAFANRLQMFTTMRNNRGLFVTDKESEGFQNVSAPLGTLDHLQAQSQEHMAAVTAIPLVKLLGVTPSGLNASTDGEIRVFYDHIHARQERLLGDPIRTVLQLLQLDLWGEIDPEISFEFLPLWELDDAGKAAVAKTRADTDAVYSELGVLGPDDIRSVLSSDEDGRYAAVDLSEPAPGVPDAEEHPDLSDPSERIVNRGEEDSETGANSGV